MARRGISGAARQLELLKAAETKAARAAECDKEIDLTHSSILKNEEEYDKQLLTLSAGFLAITLTFIKDVVKMDHAILRPVLYVAWGVLCLCIFAVLSSFQLSNAGLEKAQSYWQNQKNGDGEMPYPVAFAKWIKRCNLFSGACFLLGIILVLLFVVQNLHKEAADARQVNSVAGRPSNENSRSGRCSEGCKHEGSTPAHTDPTGQNSTAQEVGPEEK